MNGISSVKLISVSISNAISGTFCRMARELKMEGVTAYRLRHTFKTYGKRAGDREALDLMMGHKDLSMGKVYDHESVAWKRIRQVTKVVYRRLVAKDQTEGR